MKTEKTDDGVVFIGNGCFIFISRYLDYMEVGVRSNACLSTVYTTSGSINERSDDDCHGWILHEKDRDNITVLFNFSKESSNEDN